MKKLLPFLILIALLVPACGGEEEEVGDPLRITFAWPTFIDPAVGVDFSSSCALVNLYDTLVFPNAEGGVDPWLAEKWEASADGLTFTFHLREKVKFHNGDELKASDVVYSFNRLQTVGEGYAYLLGNVASATAVDDYTVRFTLPEPTGLFIPSLTRLYILNEELVRENTLADGPYGADGDYGKEQVKVPQGFQYMVNQVDIYQDDHNQGQ